ncbi:MAG: hypothetical protein OXH68_06130 [Gammaproteobacteria bacterium]|nr:hypothetical protein [Gammaproteobacteria bacterium]
MASHAILGAERVFARAWRETFDDGGLRQLRTPVLFGCCLLMAGCATVLPGVLSDFSEMKAEVSVPILRNILFEAPYSKVLESSGPVAEKHCASVGRKPVFVSMRGVDLRNSVVVVGVGATNTDDAIVLYRCDKERDEEEEAVRIALAAFSPDVVVHVWDKLSEAERRRLKDDEPFRRALDEGSLRTVSAEMDRVLGDARQTPAPPSSAT